MATYLVWLREVRQCTAESVATYARRLRLFADWCEERRLVRPSEVTQPMLERYQAWLFRYRKASGRPLTVVNQKSQVLAVQGYFRWMVRSRQLLSNPAADLVLPRVGARLPQAVLTPREVAQVLQQPDVTTPVGLRDRAVLETLYSTGMRRKELVDLSVFSISAERGTVMIREGKWKKDRVVPIGERALAWIEKYLCEVRPSWVVPPDEGVLFLTEDGDAFEVSTLTKLVRVYVRRAGVAQKGACHLFRHSMATQMLENGADVRFVQEMLGHTSLETTQIYTRVSIRKLKEVHTATHPGARLARSSAAGTGPNESEQDALLSSLAAEREEEDEQHGS